MGYNEIIHTKHVIHNGNDLLGYTGIPLDLVVNQMVDHIRSNDSTNIRSTIDSLCSRIEELNNKVRELEDKLNMNSNIILI